MAAPVEPSFIVRVATSDGAQIAVKRRASRGGTPVVFIHGLAVNADSWNLPSLAGPDFHYHSLATLLHERGFDVWLVNLRGHGGPEMLSEPAPGQGDWCVDHFIANDVPAVVDYVRSTTGQRPVMIGNSMGAMTLAGYLEGAVIATADGLERVEIDPKATRQRQGSVAACVFVEFPAALRWPKALYKVGGGVDWPAVLKDWWRTAGNANYPFEVLSRWAWLHALLESAGTVPLDWLRASPVSDAMRSILPESLMSGIGDAQRVALQKILNAVGRVTGQQNHRAEIFLEGRRYVFDHMKAGVLRQMARSVRAGGFVSGLGDPAHAYSDHYGLIETPTLVIAGGRDRIANASVTRDAFFERIGSRQKKFLLFDEIGHGEFEVAPIASEQVYPQIVRWMDERLAEQTGQR